MTNSKGYAHWSAECTVFIATTPTASLKSHQHTMNLFRKRSQNWQNHSRFDGRRGSLNYSSGLWWYVFYLNSKAHAAQMVPREGHYIYFSFVNENAGSCFLEFQHNAIVNWNICKAEKPMNTYLEVVYYNVGTYATDNGITKLEAVRLWFTQFSNLTASE